LPNSSTTEPSGTIGDPACPICHGVGFVRRDLPVDHPEFGRLQICTCRSSQVTQASRRRLFQVSNLEALQHLTFETFQPRGRIGLGTYQSTSLESAYNHSRQFASSLSGWLLLMGGYGCGKTHLAAAIANFAVSLGVPTLFLTVPDLLDWLRYTYSSEDTSFESRFEDIRTARLLVLDDFGTQNATPWAQEKLFQIINYRYINRLPLVITTNLSLDDIEGRIRSRLQDPDLVTSLRILAPDYRNPKDDAGHHELSTLGLHSNRTFGTFSLRQGEGIAPTDLKNLERVYNAALKYAEAPRGWIIFCGDYATGKTHLAAAIGNYRAAQGYPPLMVGVPDLLDHLRAAFNPNSATPYDRRFDEIRTTPMLILDDLGTQSSTPWAREKLYQLFNHRYNAELPTVITLSGTVEEQDPRLASRMVDPRLCAIHALTVPPYRGGIPSAGAPARPPVRRLRRSQ